MQDLSNKALLDLYVNAIYWIEEGDTAEAANAKVDAAIMEQEILRCMGEH
jgi:hypothetical protein